MNIDVADTTPPKITSDTLPAEGTTITSVYDRFNLGFSEDMAAATVNDPNNIEIRSAGPDGVFDSADDVFYHVASPGYSSGLSVGYRIADGPLQPGSYRVTLIDPGLTDRVGNPLAAPYVRTFAVAGVAPYILENRSNDSFATPTSLSTTPGTAPSGTFLYDWNGGVGNNPYDVATADLNADGKLDLVTANIGSNTVSIYLGNGDGTFGNRVDYATGSGPIAVSIGDVTGDGRLDLVVANEGTTTISVLAGNGDGTFAPRVDYAVGNNPYDVAIGDLNADGKLDVVAANINSNTVSVWRGKADGTLGSRVDYATGASPIAVKLADFDGDGKLDLVVANDGGNSVSVLKGLGDGTFAPRVDYATGSGTNPWDVVVADFDGDGKLDLAVSNYSTGTVGILHGQGDGTFAPVVQQPAGISQPRRMVAGDFNADGKVDLALAGYDANHLSVLLGNGDGTFSTPQIYSTGGNPISVAAGDFNNDGRLDLATANYANSNLYVLLDQNIQPLAEDPAGSGVRSGYGRGNIWGNSDGDAWSFTANAGDNLIVAGENPGYPNNSYLRYTIYRSDGQVLTAFDTSGYGNNSQGEVIYNNLPLTGTYVVYVTHNTGYQGEYRLRVTTTPGSVQQDYENNDSISGASSPALTISGVHQTATIAGYLAASDGADYYRLGNQSAGTTINLNLGQPGTSTLSAVLAIINSGGTVVATGSAGAALLSYTIPTGGDGTFYARITAASGRGLLAQYLLNIDVADTTPPKITSDTLPAEGTTITSVYDRFNLGFSEDMAAATVNDPNNIEIRSAGPDGVFDSADDVFYHVASPGYSSGRASATGSPTVRSSPGRTG